MNGVGNLIALRDAEQANDEPAIAGLDGGWVRWTQSTNRATGAGKGSWVSMWRDRFQARIAWALETKQGNAKHGMQIQCSREETKKRSSQAS
jgi:hypothetical protein